MTLGELKELCDHLSVKWTDEVDIAVSSNYLTTSDTIVGHYEPAPPEVGPVILVTGKHPETAA